MLHIASDAANRYVAFYWGGMLIGRLVGVVLLRSIKPATLLIINSVIAMSLILVSINSSGNTAVWSLIAVGLFNSVIFGIIFSLAVRGVGRHVTRASGLLSTAISGGGVVVVIQGFLIDSSSWSTAFILPLVCYLYIIFYGMNGHKSIYSREFDRVE